MPATEQYWRKLSTMHKVFAASSIALLASIIFMMVRDQQRDWRYYQTEALRLREERFSRAAEELQTEEFITRLEELESRVETEESELSSRDEERQQLEEDIQDLDGRIELAARTAKFELAEVGKARADYDLAVRDSLPEDELQERLEIFETHEELAQQYSLDLQELEAEMAEKQAALRNLTADYDAAKAALDEHREELARLQEVVDELHPSWTRSIKEWPIINAFNPNLRIEYDWPGREMLNAVQRIPIQLGMARVDRVDRCRTCHFNINEYGAGNVPMYPQGTGEGEYEIPFASHPHPELYLTSGSPHPIEEFGCTICHEGDGSGTGFQTAEHTPTDPAMARKWEEEYGWHSNHFWEYPMQPGSFVESSCIRCHHSVVELGNHPEYGATAPTAYEGYELLTRYGCYGCHEINGYDPNGRIGPDIRLEPQTEEEALAIAADPNQTAGNMRKVGPSLRHIAEKTTLEFIAYWTRDPRAFRPSTRMPQFFEQFDHLDLEDHHDALGEQLQPVELAGIAAYLIENSEPMEEMHSPQEGYTPDPARGEVEFRRCLACHTYNNETYGEFHPDFGPDLSNIHEKMLPGEDGFRWLYNWIRDPQTYHPRTRMPYQFLEPTGEGDEHVDVAADIAAFLLQREPREFPEIELPGPSLGLVVAEGEEGLVITEVLQHMAATRGQDAESPDPDRPITLLVDDVILSINGAAATNETWTALQEDLVLGQDVTLEYSRGGSRSQVVLTASDPLHDLAGLFLGKALDADAAAGVMSNRRMLVDPAAFITDENGRLPDMRSFIRGDEIELVHIDEEGNYTLEGSFAEDDWNDRLLTYVGRRTISRYGCYGCHDIPGFETARPIGTALQDWGRKDTSKLALEHIEEFLHHHHDEGGVSTAHQMQEIIRDEYYDGDASEEELTQAYFYESLMHHGRPGFIWQKLRDPRSYDFEKLETKGWDERLRMPNFHLEESEIESIATFVLGLVADPPPEPYLYRPDEATRVRIEGERLLQKYNCTSCHMLEMPGLAYRTNVYDGGFWTVGLTREQIFHWLRTNADALQELDHVQDVLMERDEASDGTAITEEMTAEVIAALDWSVPGVPGTPEEQQEHLLEHLQPFVSNGEFLFAEILPDEVDVQSDYLSYLAALAEGTGDDLQVWFDENPQSLVVTEISPPRTPSPEHPASFPLLFDLKPATTFGVIDDSGDATIEIRGLVNAPPNPELPLDEQEYSFDLWETLEVGGRYRLPGSRASILVEDVVSELPHRGGDYALWLTEHLVETDSGVQGQLAMAWQSSPPPLYLEGIKVQTPWLYEFLKNPMEIRHTTVLRMPRFNMSDEEAQTLANYFAAVAGAPFPYQSVPQRRPEYREERQEQFVALFPESEESYQTRAWQLLNADVCSKCHAVGGHPYELPDEPPAPGAVPPVHAPDLDRVNRRLQPDWLQLWLYNPKVITTYTSMPINFPHNQTSKPELFGGNPTIQTQAARDALMDYPHLIETHGVIAYVDPTATPEAETEGTTPEESPEDGEATDEGTQDADAADTTDAAAPAEPGEVTGEAPPDAATEPEDPVEPTDSSSTGGS